MVTLHPTGLAGPPIQGGGAFLKFKTSTRQPSPGPILLNWRSSLVDDVRGEGYFLHQSGDSCLAGNLFLCFLANFGLR